jgi:hypothetical protein
MSNRTKKTTDETAPAKKQRKSLAPLTDEQRFATGVFTIPEAARFCACSISSISSINKDIREKRLAIVKHGRRTRILGPALASFMRGE